MKNLIAYGWFFMILLWVTLLLFFAMFMIPSDIIGIFKSGFANQSSGITMFSVCSMIVGISLMVPVFRRIFDKLPWLYNTLIILLMDLFMLAVVEKLINFGFEKVDATRHTIFTLIAVLSFIILRICMCIYLNKKPLIEMEDDIDEE